MPLAAAEATSRLSSYALVAYITRTLGVEVLGVFSLGQTLSQYLQVGGDLGTKLIGARLVAKNIGLARLVIVKIQKKRIFLTTLSITLGCIYALLGPVPEVSRLFLFLFALSFIPSAFALDWLVWGMDQLALLGLWRVTTNVLFVGGSIIFMYFMHADFLVIAVSNGVSLSLGAIGLWLAWTVYLKPPAKQPTEHEKMLICQEVKWNPILLLGLAAFLNQMFHNVDTLLLGAMSTITEVGRYNAAYRIIFLIFGGYYLLTQSAYPALVRLQLGHSGQKIILKYAAVAVLFGSTISLILGYYAPEILGVLYGSELIASKDLLRVLLLGLPLEFAVSLFGTALNAWGHHKILLLTTGSAAIFNVLLNLFLIPRMAAMGAALATVASYALLASMLSYVFVFKPISDPQKPADVHA